MKKTVIYPLFALLLITHVTVGKAEDTKKLEKASSAKGGDKRPGNWMNYGKPPFGYEGFERLTEEERKSLREAFEQVWARPEVITAKEKAMCAHAELGEVIQEAMVRTDPKAAEILKKLNVTRPADPRKLPPLPPLDSAEFPEAIVNRLKMNAPWRGGAAGAMHEKLVQEEAVRAAIESVKKGQGEDRIKAVRELFKAYRESAMKELGKTKRG